MSKTVAPTDWWYYFEKIDAGKRAKCRNCSWIRDRGAAKSTYNLKYHLEHQHQDLWSKKLEAERMKQKKQDDKLHLQERVQTSLNFENIVSEKDLSDQNLPAKTKNFPIFGK